MEDTQLLQTYYLGFKDELDSITRNWTYVPLEQRAYDLGRLHALIGDEVKSVDSLTEEEILKLINKN